jgi:opacity protein-like surface antigen
MHAFFSRVCWGLSLGLYCLSLMALTAQVCQANARDERSSFKGFYVGGNLGYVSGLSKERFQAAAIPGGASISANNKSGLDGIDGGINLGYTYVFACNPFALGLEGAANWSNIRGKHTFSAVRAFPPVNTNFSAHAEIRQTLQLMGRLGYVLGRAMPFLTLGWANSSRNFKSTANIESPAFPGFLVLSENKSKRINGIAYGAGIDVSLRKCLIAGLEYTHIDYQSQSGSAAAGGRSATFSSQLHTNKFAATLKFLFY